MQYMLLCYADEAQWERQAPERIETIMQEIDAVVQDIVRSGHFRAAGRLQPVASATSVRERHGALLTTDGPFAETKEQLGGYYLVECKDLDEALGIAKRIAATHPGGLIEVRPLRPTFRG
ncbi:MAG: YciI family protein [bacterium]